MGLDGAEGPVGGVDDPDHLGVRGDQRHDVEPGHLLQEAHRLRGRVGHDDLVPQSLQMASDPLALGARLDQDFRAWSVLEHGVEPLTLRADPLLDDLAIRGHDADLALMLVQVDADMVHGCLREPGIVPRSDRGRDPPPLGRLHPIWRMWVRSPCGWPFDPGDQVDP